MVPYRRWLCSCWPHRWVRSCWRHRPPLIAVACPKTTSVVHRPALLPKEPLFHRLEGFVPVLHDPFAAGPASKVRAGPAALRPLCGRESALKWANDPDGPSHSPDTGCMSSETGPPLHSLAGPRRPDLPQAKVVVRREFNFYSTFIVLLYEETLMLNLLTTVAGVV
jgi:hypothetical protein